MVTDKVSIKGIKNINDLDIDFEFTDSNIILITGKNGAGKTTLVKAFHLLNDPEIFAKSSGEDVLGSGSSVSFSLEGLERFGFFYNKKLNGFDTRDKLPSNQFIASELPIPYGSRFERFKNIAQNDSEIRANIASNKYFVPHDLIKFLSDVYGSNKFDKLMAVNIQKKDFYFILKDNDYYVREDHFSSGEFFLIQLFTLIKSSARLIIIDELDVALDATAQVNLYAAIKPILHANNSRLIAISHSLALMQTVDDGCLYYLDNSSETASLDQRSFGYIKSVHFGFRGFDRYIITEDSVLAGFIEYLIRRYAMECYYRHITIGVGGFNQVELLVEKNDSEQIFAQSSDILCVVDGDVINHIRYGGPTKIISSNIDDLEVYIYTNRDKLFNGLEHPHHRESDNKKKASKNYWKWLTTSANKSTEELYKIIDDSENQKTKKLQDQIANFLKKQ